MGKRNLIILVLVAFVILAGGFWLLSQNNNAPSESNNVANESDQANSDDSLENDMANENESMDELIDDQGSSTEVSEDDPATSGINDDGGTNNNTSEYEVVYSSNGFDPATLTVPMGTTVTFRNESSKDMWVASDPHPVHTDYSDFDSMEGFSNGEFYEYSFMEAGTYDYHNHLGANHGGTIIVQ